MNKHHYLLIYFIFHQLQMEMAFPKELFRFAWNIAEFIINGNRRERDEQMTVEQYRLIQYCWCHNPKERLKIDDVVSLLETMLIN